MEQTSIDNAVNNTLDDIALNLVHSVNKGQHLGNSYLAQISHNLNTPLTSVLGFLELMDAKMGTKYSREVSKLNYTFKSALEDMAHLLAQLWCSSFNFSIAGVGDVIKLITEDQLKVTETTINSANLDPAASKKEEFILDKFRMYKGIIEGLDSLGERYLKCKRALELINVYKSKELPKGKRIQDLLPNEELESLSPRARIEVIMQLGLILPYQNNEKGKYLDIGYKEMVKLEEFIDGFLSGNITNYLKQRGSLVFKCE